MSVNSLPAPVVTPEVSTSSTSYVCASWCTDRDGHPDYVLRDDQACWGPEYITVLGLDEHAPAVGRPYEYGQPHLSVFAHRRWHQLPTIRLHAYRESSTEHLCVDHDFHLTADEALHLAAALIDVATMLGGAR